MKVAYTSDTHNEFKDIPLNLLEDADVLILAGDIHHAGDNIRWAADYLKQVEAVIVVAGNHEYYGRDYDQALMTQRQLANELGVHFLENNAVKIGEKVFVGGTLWTDFMLYGEAQSLWLQQKASRRMNDYRVIHDSGFPIDPEFTIAKHKRTRKFLSLAIDELKPDVIVTHHAPSGNSAGGHAGDDLTAAYCSDLPDLLNQKELVWVHGHTHYPVDYFDGKVRVVSNPRGYPGEHGLESYTMKYFVI